MDWQKFFGMGGYGLYVWGSYGVTLLVLVAEIVLVCRRARTIRGEVGRIL
jgi:heme exporter protein D